MSTEKLADALRVEVGLIVGNMRAPIVDEVACNYADFVANGVEHYAARDYAVECAIQSFSRRCDLANACGQPEEAARFWQPAFLLMRQWRKLSGAAIRNPSPSIRRADAGVLPCAPAPVPADRSFPLMAKDGPTRGAPGNGD